MRYLVTGATGYIGGRLAARLLESGHSVRCLSRSAGRLRGVPWADRAEIVGCAPAARAAGVRRIVSLGGAEPPSGVRQSAHLRSRAEVARILLDSGVPTV